MASVRLVDNIGVGEEVIRKACKIAMKTHKSPEKQYLSEKLRNSSAVVFSFPARNWLVNEWFQGSPFGTTKVDVDLDLFSSLKYIGLNEKATVNDAFLRRFKAVLDNPKFINEVEAAVRDGKQVVFTGHSLGGPIAILATIWFLEMYQRSSPPRAEPICLTFGSPLVGDKIMNHALMRENWSRYFIHFVMRYDIVPRISLSPLSSIQQQLQQILNFFNPKSHSYKQEPVQEAPVFYETVIRNASSVASYTAAKMMGSSNLMLETVSNIIELSPYRPFGTYIFCAGNQKRIMIKNSDAILQLLFYSSQLSSLVERDSIALRSIKDHLNYVNELQESSAMQTVTLLDDNHLEKLPLSSDGVNNEMVCIALNDLGLSSRARLCLRAAEELEKQKKRNQEAIDKKRGDIETQLKKLEAYKSKCELNKIGYYDAFKISRSEDDFKANIARLELAGIWDEIVEMLKRYELPDNFEAQEEWINLGTRYRHISEPLDIANYYRHLKNEDTGAYMKRGRPRRYQCTQRWREHAKRMTSPSLESCFWAEVEELCLKTTTRPETEESIMRQINELKKWIESGEIGKDVLLEDSTFMKLLKQHSLANMVQNL
ncbi:hypothetical protein K2173_022726 [Erythroxylum novogranatense]|uniref:Uncharacterized protein n=1 Tax=Erythroxylum novogranatense TaxID=1862640 RepID=A0AAV8SN67_9ROSI|nr:hypothetical protein K2173_022726 [Erythroxylum novogranatense]